MCCQKSSAAFPKRVLIDELRARYCASLRQTCALLKLSRTVYGYRRVHVLLKREGFKDNHKRVYRLYREEGLSLRLKRPKRNKSARLRQPKHFVTAINRSGAWISSLMRCSMAGACAP